MPTGQFRMCRRTSRPTFTRPVAKPSTSAQVVPTPKAVNATWESQSIIGPASHPAAALSGPEELVPGHLQPVAGHRHRRTQAAHVPQHQPGTVGVVRAPGLAVPPRDAALERPVVGELQPYHLVGAEPDPRERRRLGPVRLRYGRG